MGLQRPSLSVPGARKVPQDACCTCATLLSESAVRLVTCSFEKPPPDNRRLDCCGRIICGNCMQSNPRFTTYCPYCQTSGQSLSNSRLPKGWRRETETGTDPSGMPDLPPYSTIASGIIEPSTNGTQLSDYDNDSCSPPPPYTPFPSSPAQSLSLKPDAKQQQRPEDQDQDPGGGEGGEVRYVIHHLRHTHPQDTVLSLSLRYGVSAEALRRHNGLTSDHLLAARRTVRIPIPTTTTTTSSGTVTPFQSLSPTPVEDEAEVARKTAIRRWMVACKEADYDVAVVYLEGAGYDLDEAVRRYVADELWARENPLPSSSSSSSTSRSLLGGRKGRWRGR